MFNLYVLVPERTQFWSSGPYVYCLALRISLIILKWIKYLESASRKQEFINNCGIASICTREIKLRNVFVTTRLPRKFVTSQLQKGTGSARIGSIRSQPDNSRDFTKPSLSTTVSEFTTRSPAPQSFAQYQVIFGRDYSRLHAPHTPCTTY